MSMPPAMPSSRLRRTGRLFALLLAGLLAACGGRAMRVEPRGGDVGPVEDGAPPEAAPAVGDPAHGHEHGHDHEHDHAHDEDGGPPPMEIGPQVVQGPHDGLVARLSRLDEPDFGFVELKLHDDKGDLELWIARDRAMARPFDLPLDTVVTVHFPDHDDRRVELRVRDRDTNPDEDGRPNVREGGTHYFIFPGETGADAAWLRGAAFTSLVRVTFVHRGDAYVSDDFILRPHTHAGGHGHEHDDER